MANLNDPKEILPCCLFDSDVLINWLTKEEDNRHGIKLWEAPLELIELIESKSLRGCCSLITLLEMRFVFRRKKSLTEAAIQKIIEELMNVIPVIIPDEVSLLKANSLQIENHLSAFDALIVAVGRSTDNAVLISRDKTLLKSANRYLNSFTPEEFLNIFKSK